MAIFQDRIHAGRALAAALRNFQGRRDLLVLALPRGGVPVGFEVARQLRAPLDILVVRKLGVPGHEELAMGALASGDLRVLEEDIIGQLGIPSRAIDEATRRARQEIARREQAYRGDRPAEPVEGRVVILVDDGLATGATMRASAQAVRRRGPSYLVVGAPVGSAAGCDDMRAYADEVVCVATPEPLYGVGLWYQDFSQTSDDEVRRLLAAAAAGRAGEEAA